MFPEIHQLINPSSPNHQKWYIQLFRAFKPTVYLYRDGIWGLFAYGDEAYYDTKEAAVLFLQEHPYVEESSGSMV
jgi:hypothetical protein